MRVAALLLWLAAPAVAAAQDPPQDPPVEPPVEKEPDVPIRELDAPSPRAGADSTPQGGTRRLTRARSPRSSTEPFARVGGGLGYGRFHINARELGGHDDQDAGVFRLDADIWINPHIGFGLTGELVGVGEDLFEGQQVESGVGLRPADAELSSHDFAPYFQWDPIARPRFRLPLQIGPWFQGVFLDYERANIDYTFSTFGLRVGARPELALVETEKVDVVLFGGATYGIGFTEAYEDLIGENERYDTDAKQFRAEGGVRVDLRHVSLGLHYVFSDTSIDISDVENGRRVPEVDFYTNMFFFTVAGRF